MALKPVLKIKVDELFLRWLSNSEVQVSLRDSLAQLARGEAVSATAKSSQPLRGNSPRGTSNTLVTPTSPKLPSPHSPRRPLHVKKQNVGVVDNQKPVINAGTKDKDVGITSGTAVEPAKVRQGTGLKDTIPSHNNGDGLSNSTPELYPGTRKLPSKEDDVQQPFPAPRQSVLKDVKSINKIASDVRDNNKENRQKKQRSSRQIFNVHIPQFYFPSGKPGNGAELDNILQRVALEFNTLDGGKAYKQQMAAITKACGLPLYWKILLFRAAGGTKEGFITFQTLSVLLKKLYQTCHDDAAKFMRMAAKSGVTTLDFDDFEPLVQDVVETHPGLTFLQDAPEFHSRYVTTVISRVMFCVNRSWSGRITLAELRKSNFLQTLRRLEDEEDINQIKDFFSYEHFYVIYCKFWELDKDHDLYIDKNDLSRHNDHALNSRLIDRIFSGAVTRGPDFQESRMSYKEFVWFLLAEEDKKHPTSIEYWFRCMDLDGDGVISMYEMEYFHEEQMNKMETLGIEKLPFEDTVCQMMDMVCPKTEGKITLGDLKACKMTNIFFDTFFNLDKFLEHEQRDPFANARDPNLEPIEVNDWNRYAEEEYDILVADEGNADVEDGNYEDDFEPEDDDEVLREEMLRLADEGTPQRSITTGQSHTAEDIYDFSNTGLGY
ncbi:serine/threonine-protein phosphatase 2A regulatory subunit B'' subunit beta-like isoform X2 [Physella acuta]|uniref:serine/threonine-protein phosphatase 2A regulatory subunit B'' subunit beta-like isoform X2 n=1 Tax=Physella acuta TaxID=109671 RepID=UPI0027DC822D|nr:serine/threonine-protein phosphatase 2A regulatory subunit B'' subunit beta-like isoform X2 [Physella acuta]